MNLNNFTPPSSQRGNKLGSVLFLGRYLLYRAGADGNLSPVGLPSSPSGTRSLSYNSRANHSKTCPSSAGLTRTGSVWASGTARTTESGWQKRALKATLARSNHRRGLTLAASDPWRLPPFLHKYPSSSGFSLPKPTGEPCATGLHRAPGVISGFTVSFNGRARAGISAARRGNVRGAVRSSGFRGLRSPGPHVGGVGE